MVINIHPSHISIIYLKLVKSIHNITIDILRLSKISDDGINLLYVVCAFLITSLAIIHIF